MTERFSEVGARVKAVATNCILKHCIIHREALAVKPLSSDKAEKNGTRRCFGYCCENCELHKMWW